MMMPYKLVKLLLIIMLGVYGALFYSKRQHLILAKPRFVLGSNADIEVKSVVPIFESEIIPQPAYLPAAHSSSFTMMSNGDLLAFWFAGTKEGQPDVKIWQSTYHDNRWSFATALVDPDMIARANHRYVIKVGNPVIYKAANDVLHLFVVSVSVGGWSGSNLNHLQSHDNGYSWTKPERIVISPFFNVSTLVRTSAVSLADGGFYLPVYYELMRKYPELLWFDANGKFIEQIRISNKNLMLQPSVVPTGILSAWAFFRNGAKPDARDKTLYAAKTDNGGLRWSKPEPTNLTNPDSSVVGANLNDGRMLMVYNEAARANLLLGISYDGLKWEHIYTLENTPGEEFSYPSIQVNGNIIDILYTNNRKNIKHVRFNLTWLNEVVNHVKR